MIINRPPSDSTAIQQQGAACDLHHEAHEAEDFDLRTVVCNLNDRHLGGHRHAKHRARRCTVQNRFDAEARKGSSPWFDTSHRVQSDVHGRRGEKHHRRCFRVSDKPMRTHSEISLARDRSDGNPGQAVSTEVAPHTPAQSEFIRKHWSGDRNLQQILARTRIARFAPRAGRYILCGHRRPDRQGFVWDG